MSVCGLPCAVSRTCNLVHCGLSRRLRPEVRIMWDILGYSGIFWDIWSLMFFRKDPPQTDEKEGVTLIY